MEKSKTIKSPLKKEKFSGDNIIPFLLEWVKDKRWYFFAFFLPVLFVIIAYSVYGMYPFGDQCVLILDMNGQYIYFYEGMRDAFWGDGSFFYNWSRNLSGEFMGTIGYYTASPFNLVIYLLPREMILGSVYIVQLLKVGTSAVTFLYFLRKSMNMDWMRGMIFSNCYALMAYMIVQLMDVMWLDGLVFLPLIILGIQNIINRETKLLYCISLGLMFWSHFYIGMMIAIFCVIYFIYYLCFGTERFSAPNAFSGRANIKKSIYDIFMTCVRFGVCSLIAAMLAAFMLLPVYSALQQGKSSFMPHDLEFKTQFVMLDVLPRLLPFSYDTCRPEGMMDIYAGAITIFLLPLYFLNSKINAREKIGSIFLLTVMLISMYIKTFDRLWHGGQQPQWLNYRYSFIFSFIIIVMAAKTLKNIEGIRISSIGGTLAGFALIFAFLETRPYAEQVNYKNLGFDSFKVFWLSLIIFMVYGLIITMMKHKKESVVLLGILFACVSGELYVHTQYLLVDAVPKDVGPSKRSSYYEFMEAHRDIVDRIEEADDTLWRGDKTYYRMTNDNVGTGLRGLSNSASVMNRSILDYLGKLGYDMEGYRGSYRGGNPLTDSLLGIKYVLNREVSSDSNGVPDPGWSVDSQYIDLPQFTTNYYNPAGDYTKTKNGSPSTPNPQPNEEIHVYQNPYYLPIGYMISKDFQQLVSFNEKNVFKNNNILLSTMTGNTEWLYDAVNPPEITGFKEYFKPIIQYDEPILNNVSWDPNYMHYNQTGVGDHTVEYHLLSQSDDPMYLFFPTRDQQKVNIWIQTALSEDGVTFVEPFAYKNGEYFQPPNYAMMKLGSFPAGTKIAVRVTVLNSYTEINEALFCYLDMKQLDNDLTILRNNSWNITSWKSNHIEGTIKAEQNQVMFTSIPYEKGWTIKVDGKKQEPVKLMENFIGINLQARDEPYTVEMTFIPDKFPLGVVLGIIGIGILVIFYIYDKKHNKFYLEIAKEKKDSKK